MSGFEVAEVVLAVFPLLVKAIQELREVARSFSNSLLPKQISARAETCGAKGMHSERPFRALMTRLLSRAVTATELERLLIYPEGPAWHNPLLVAKAQSHLESTHSGCLIIIEDTRKTVQDLQKFSAPQGFKAMHSLASENAYEETLLCEIWEEIGRLQVWGCTLERPPSVSERLLRALENVMTDLETYVNFGFKVVDESSLRSSRNVERGTEPANFTEDREITQMDAAEVLQDTSDVIASLYIFSPALLQSSSGDFI
ncbi:MAG: hypothetical protein M1830_001808 [Pleopsidium flavum]|nr:MAG: hypothetical protein M1830_002486 [Pleopsidium flavum]KAI9878125.1 MAG: hypothetical protein M1830_001808 [Pleopsidium flavum]